MSLNTSQPSRPIDYDEIRQVANVAEIIDVATVRFSAEAGGPLVGIDARDFRQKISFRAERMATPKDLIVVSVNFEFAVFVASGETVSKVNGTLNVVYGLPDERPQFSDAQLDVFAEVNGIYSAWPFIRELVATCSTRLGVGGATLPIWRPPSELPPRGEARVMERAPLTSESEPGEE